MAKKNINSSFIGRVLDNYRILESLGQGGMGMVFKALNVKLDKIVAIKILAPGLSMNDNFIKRFQTEARALAKLENRNIVNIYDLRSDNFQWFIVMEFVDGKTLGDLISGRGAFSWDEALKIFKQMLNAIGHAHSAGIIHRDIKPNNVLITENGIVKITDFGLAKDQQYTGNTVTFASGGTLFYMSPEQVRGLQFTDLRSDIYALGITLYEMLAGKTPFKESHTDFDIRETIVRKEFPPPVSYNPKIPSGLNDIVMKAISKDPDTRYQSVKDLSDAIDYFESNYTSRITYNTQNSEKNRVSDKKAASQSALDYRGSLETDILSEAINYGKSKHSAGKFAATGLIILLLFVIAFLLFPDNIPWFKSDPDKAMVAIDSSPRQASVIVDEIPIGVTPLNEFKSESGMLKLRLKKSGFFDIDTTVVIEKDHNNAFIFNLTPAADVSLNILPVDSEIQLDGKMISAEMISELRLTVGDHSIEVSHPGYESEIFQFYADAGKNAPLNFRLRKKINNISEISEKYGILSVKSNPEGAEILLNNRFVGKTPFTGNKYPEGEYDLLLRRNGYVDYSQKVVVRPNQSFDVMAALIKKAGSLTISSEPSDAMVSLDGKELKGKLTPFTLESVAPGKHDISIKKEGYSGSSGSITVSEDQESEFFGELKRLMGDLEVHVKPWGTIYIDGKLMKKDTDLKYMVQLPAIKHMVRVVHPSLGVCEKEIHVEHDETVKFSVDFNKIVNVSVSAFDSDGKPVWGEIIVDGQNTGEMTPKEIKLRVGMHTIAVKKDGYVLIGGEKQILVDEEGRIFQKFILKRNG
ncbi:MAG: PEGA domain-containing protein [Calditrichaceae bacterium]